MTIKQIPFTVNKKNISLTPSRMTIYKLSKVIEAQDKKQNYYYLFFYKNNFLTGVKANQLKINSHVEKAFKHGIILTGTHPLTMELIRQQQSFPYTRFNQLFKKVQQKYTLTETALLFTFFDSFIPKTEIKKLIKKAYYQFRRNGQLFAAFKILKIYQQHDGEDPFTKEMLNNLQFQPFEVMYQDRSKLVSKDVIYLESICFDQLDRPDNVDQLLELYHDQGRWMDELSLRLFTFASESKSEDLSKLQSLMIDHFDYDQQIKLLTSIVDKSAHDSPVRPFLLDNLLKHKNHDDIVHYILKYDINPPSNQLHTVSTSFEQAKLSTFLPFFDQLNSKLVQLFKEDHKLLESTINRCVSAFFNQYDLSDIIDWFVPIREAGIHLPIEQKLIKMKTLEDDPDQQYALGELYLYFDQLERSIDCFKWEMELKPSDPKPVQSLTKLYKKLGDKEEAKAYQQLLIQMQK